MVRAALRGVIVGVVLYVVGVLVYGALGGFG